MWGPVCPAEDHFIVSSHVANQEYSEAVERADRAVERFDRTPRLLAAQAEAYAAAGRKAEAEKLLEELAEAAEERYVDPTLLAIVHIVLDHPDRAFEMLERAFEARSPWLPVIKVDAKFDPLRDDPRFDDLLRRMGLAPERPAGRRDAA